MLYGLYGTVIITTYYLGYGHHITLLTTPFHTTPFTTSRHVTPRHVTPHHTTPHHTTPHHTTPHHVTPHHVTPHHTITSPILVAMTGQQACYAVNARRVMRTARPRKCVRSVREVASAQRRSPQRWWSSLWQRRPSCTGLGGQSYFYLRDGGGYPLKMW